MVDIELLKQWEKERNSVIESLDIEAFKKFIKKWQKKGVYRKIQIPKDKVLMASLCKMAVHYRGTSNETKSKALKWLNKNGFSMDIK